MVLFIMLYKVVITFESGDEILMCAHSNENAVVQYFLMVMVIAHNYK